MSTELPNSAIPSTQYRKKTGGSVATQINFESPEIAGRDFRYIYLGIYSESWFYGISITYVAKNCLIR